MANRPRRLIRKNLRRKGFIKEEGRHEKWRFVPHGIATPYYVTISRSPKFKDYGSKLLGFMAKDELEISKDQLLDLIDCPMTQEDLEDLYISRYVFTERQVRALMAQR